MPTNNYIQHHRDLLSQYFAPHLRLLDEHESELSPTGRYQLEVDIYQTKDPLKNWHIAKVIINDTLTQEQIIEFKRDDDRFFRGWFERSGTEYLVCSEALTGQTVIDLTHRHMESYVASQDGFIWTGFHLAPDTTRLAVEGCYWACPYILAIYDFTHPLRLPLPCLMEIPLLDEIESGYWEVSQWRGNQTIVLTKDGRERIIAIET